MNDRSYEPENAWNTTGRSEGENQCHLPQKTGISVIITASTSNTSWASERLEQGKWWRVEFYQPCVYCGNWWRPSQYRQDIRAEWATLSEASVTLMLCFASSGGAGRALATMRKVGIVASS